VASEVRMNIFFLKDWTIPAYILPTRVQDLNIGMLSAD